MNNAANQGANENNYAQRDVQGAQPPDEEQGDEDQGATRGTEDSGSDDDNDSNNSDDDDNDDDEDDAHREEERRRRGQHFQTFEGEEYGQGKRDRKPPTSFSFFQTTLKN